MCIIQLILINSVINTIITAINKVLYTMCARRRCFVWYSTVHVKCSAVQFCAAFGGSACVCGAAQRQPRRCIGRVGLSAPPNDSMVEGFCSRGNWPAFGALGVIASMCLAVTAIAALASTTTRRFVQLESNHQCSNIYRNTAQKVLPVKRLSAKAF